MAKIRVDIDDLSDKLNAMKDEDYVTTELSIEEDAYSAELNVAAVSFDSDEPIDFGSIPESNEEL